MKELFQSFDARHKGRLVIGDLVAQAMDIKEAFTHEEFEDMLAEADRQGDGDGMRGCVTANAGSLCATTSWVAVR